MSATTTDTTMKNTKNTLITTTCFLSSISLMKLSFIRSRVRVELEVKTSEARVDIDAESTSMITIPIKRSGRVASMLGMMPS